MLEVVPQSAKQAGKQRGARRKVLNQNGFVLGMRAFTHGPHSVQRGNAERGGEVAVWTPLQSPLRLA